MGKDVTVHWSRRSFLSQFNELFLSPIVDREHLSLAGGVFTSCDLRVAPAHLFQLLVDGVVGLP